MSTNQSFTENKAAINGKRVQICGWISQPRFTIYYLLTRCEGRARGFEVQTELAGSVHEN